MYTHVKYEGSKSYKSKDMAIVKTKKCGQTDARTDGPRDKRTGQKLYAPDLSMWGRKKNRLMSVYRIRVRSNLSAIDDFFLHLK